MMTLQVVWFFLIGVLFTGYAILDGFDLGVGFWHLFTKKNKDRRVMLNAIGPVWDGNEVWLLTGGGALFAAFPMVYATVFSGFYLALMLVLFGLIFRAVSLEFRSKVEGASWRSKWDLAFSMGSIVPALLFGVAVGNILRGVPLDQAGNFAGTFIGLLNPYSLLIGLTGLAMFAMHGALYITIKAEGDLAEQSRNWAGKAWIAYIVLLAIAFIATILTQPQLLANAKAHAVLWLIPALALGATVAIGVLNKQGKPQAAFLASALAIAANWGLVGAGIFPNLVPALGQPEYSLNLYQHSSSQLTLTAMLIITLIGMPIVLGYTIFVYRKFAGKVQMGPDSY